jgi:hypothetical protein
MTTTLRWIFFVVFLALGIGIGLYYALVISPVQYVDTTPGTLRIDYRSDYTLMVAEVYKKDQNIDLAARRLAVLGSQPPFEIVAQAIAFGQQYGYSANDLALLQNLAAALQVWQPGSTPQPTGIVTGTATATATATGTNP